MALQAPAPSEKLPPGVPSTLPWVTGLLLGLTLLMGIDAVQLTFARAPVLAVLSAAGAAVSLLCLGWYRARHKVLVEIGNRIGTLASGGEGVPVALTPRLLGPFSIDSDDEVGYLAARLNGVAALMRESSEGLEAERSQTLHILASMESGVLLTDSSGRIEVANPAAGRMLGRPAESLRGAALGDLASSSALEDRLRQAALRSETSTVPLLLETHRHAVAIVSPMGGDTAGAVVVLQDQEEQKRLESVRRDFIANVSHELRTPLASVRAMAETLRDGGLEDQSVAGPFLDIMLTEVDRLTRLTDDILDLARYESGRLEMADLDLNTLLQDVVRQVRSNARQAKLELRVDAPHLPPIKGDASALRQVLLNLLDNAIKYTEKGAVSLSARVEQTAAGRWIRLAVEDTGPGIPAEHLSRIFERFYRVDRARSRALGGTGLGLSIVRHVVESHRGRVGVESTVGKGATFTVWLPVE